MAQPQSILLVDDEAHVRTYVAMLLRANFPGVSVTGVGDQAEALAAYRASRPDLVLLDVNLIGITGHEVLRCLREIDPSAVVVMLTSVSVRRSIEEAAHEGASGYLLKDMPHEELAAALKDVIVPLFNSEAGPDTPTP
jgi:two-component system chemotaxis response regulator CheY